MELAIVWNAEKNVECIHIAHGQKDNF